MQDTNASSTQHVWRHSTMYIYTLTSKGKSTDCIVQKNNSLLTVQFDYDYHDGNGLVPVSYIGKEHGIGHWSLEGTDGYKATLHQLAPESCFLEGYWQLGADQGFWRIHLSDDGQADGAE